MPVGTQGTVKAMTPRDLEDVGASIILGNTYHLYLRPGDDLIARRGGLHRFMGWRGRSSPTAAAIRCSASRRGARSTKSGVAFRSHLDGARMLLTPEKAVDIQAQLGSDIAMVLDECPALPSTPSRLRALGRADRALGARAAAAASSKSATAHAVVGHQCRSGAVRDRAGGHFAGSARVERRADRRDRLRGLRHRRPQRRRARRGDVRRVELTAPLLPADRPRYLMGVGTPLDLVEVRGARHRHVRLRDADAQRAQRPTVHQRRAGQHQERALRRGRRPGRSGVRVLHVPALFTGLFTSSFPRRRDHSEAPLTRCIICTFTLTP